MRETQGFLDIDGCRLEYQLLVPSQSHDRTLVFLHEGLGCLAMWKDFPQRVAEMTGCQALVYSRAGYGRSGPCVLPRPLSFMHDEGLKILPQVLTAAAIEDAVLVGHSDGASIALINAGGVDDQRVRGLVLMAPHVFVEELTISSIRKAKSAYQTTELRERLSRYHGSNVDRTFLGWVDAWLDERFLSWNIEAYLPNISVPVLLIQGEEDNYGTLRQLQTIQARLPATANQLVLPGCGHTPFRDCPEKTLVAITEFMQQLGASERC